MTPQEFESLFLPHYRIVQTIADRNYTFNKEQARDLTQDVFAKAYKNRDNYKPELSSPKTWLMTTLHTTYLDHRRKKKSKRRIEFTEPLDKAYTIGTPPNVFEEQFGDEELRAIAKLPKRFIPVLETLLDTDLTYADSCKKLGMNMNTYKVNVHRIKRHLQKELL